MYSGVIAPLVTPLREDGTVCPDGVARLVEHVAPHVSGLMPALSTGEGWLLDDWQWLDVLDATLRHRRGLPVFVGVQSDRPEVLADRIRLASGRGVDGVVVGPPMRPGCGPEEVLRHFTSLRALSGVPVFLYNEAALAAELMDVATITRLAELGGVVGIKESSGDPDVTARIVAAVPDVPVFQGWENRITAVPTAGFIGPLADLEPAVCAAALADPTPERQAEVDRLAARYGIFDDEWFVPLKRELVARGVIGSARTVRGTEPVVAGAS